MAEGNTALNALVGAVASIVLAFIPFSTVLGGALAGYLQGGDTREGVRVGAISDAIAAVPFLLIAAFLVFFLPFFPIEVAAFGFVVLAVIVLVVFVYTVATSALGGALGVYLQDEL